MKSSAVSQVIKKIELNPDTTKISRGLELQNGKIVFGKDREFEVRIADSMELRVQAYRLIYEIYLEKNYIESHESKMWFSKYDASESMITLVVLKDKAVVGSLSLLFDAEDCSPVKELYYEELLGDKSESRQLVELVSLGIDSTIRGASDVLSKLFNMSLVIAKNILEKDDFVITVNPRHVNFYKKKLLFYEAGGLKKCPKVGGAPSKLLCLELNEYQKWVSLGKGKRCKARAFYDTFISIDEGKRLKPTFIEQMRSAIESLEKINDIMVMRDEVAEELNLFEQNCLL